MREREHSYDTFRGWDSEREREKESKREGGGREGDRASGGWIMFLSEIIKISPPFPGIYEHIHLVLLLPLMFNITHA